MAFGLLEKRGRKTKIVKTKTEKADPIISS